jgi:SagB-type dehydrogenase family enzyme
MEANRLMKIPSEREATDIVAYHEQTKHRFERMARSLGYLDWQNQPAPFRSYQGSKQIRLPFIKEDPQLPYPLLYSPPGPATQAFALSSIAAFLELSLGLSAWKATASSRWALRINPSSGNLHPTEAHLLVPAATGLAAGIYHYNPLQHALELRAQLPDGLGRRIRDHFQTDGLLVALTSIHWRESWKYGERAFRYCQHDAGHALACLAFSARLQGWSLSVLNSLSDDDLEALLGLDQIQCNRCDREDPDLLCWVHAQDSARLPDTVPPDIIAQAAALPFCGRPNVLSRQTLEWELIDQAVALSRKPPTPAERIEYGPKNHLPVPPIALSATQVIRRRRSAVRFERDGGLPRDRFLAMLDRTRPQDRCPPFSVQLMPATLDLLIFVHNVEGLAQGLYFFLRHEAHLNPLRQVTHPGFAWEPVMAGFPLYRLKAADFRFEAMEACCQQEIAGFGAFCLAMIAPFQPLVSEAPYRYRHLFWEAGMIGQILYLEAEAHGVRGTGIGCYFDDAVHDLMGLDNNAFQSLYHFTVGRPIEDPRLSTLPPYHHLSRQDRG